LATANVSEINDLLLESLAFQTRQMEERTKVPQSNTRLDHQSAGCTG
jgi:hypothetical protein